MVVFVCVFVTVPSSLWMFCTRKSGTSQVVIIRVNSRYLKEEHSFEVTSDKSNSPYYRTWVPGTDYRYRRHTGTATERHPEVQVRQTTTDLNHS